MNEIVHYYIKNSLHDVSLQNPFSSFSKTNGMNESEKTIRGNKFNKPASKRRL